MMMNLTNDSCGSGGGGPPGSGGNYMRARSVSTTSTSILGSCGSSLASSNSSFGATPMISRLLGGISPTSTTVTMMSNISSNSTGGINYTSSNSTSTTSVSSQQQQSTTVSQSSPNNEQQQSSSSSILSSPRGRSTSTITPPEDVVKCGYLRKVKGSRKFFVLRRETDSDHPARLEYYVNDKVFRTGKPPRKTVALKTCFNISGTEKKGKYTINLHTKNDCVQISMTNEQEMNEWLKIMNALAGQEEEEHHVEGKSHFEHVWMVHALNKGLGSKENIIGPYRLQLTSKELALYKFGEHDGRNDIVRFPLNVIRNVSHDASLGCFFHIELGRLAPTGPGQLSLKTDDNNITQNMHLLILKAMQNYSKEDVIPRVRLDTWNSDSNSSVRSMHSTPPGMSRINSMDGSITQSLRIRTDSVSSAAGGASQTQGSNKGMSPPVPIIGPTPSISFNSPKCSTGTDSASSSYSVDFDNNNHSIGGDHMQHAYSESIEDESYVAWNPADDQHHSLNSLGSLTLPLNQDMSDYVDTSIVSRDSTSSAAQTPSSYMEMQSPMSPFDNYLPMSPAGMANAGSSIKYNNGGKSSVNHSRNSSLLEDMDGYVPMIPGGQHSRTESGAESITGSTNGLDENYLDMDLSRKLNISNDDLCRGSPASNESLPSNTPSSEFPLEKVMSYLTDDMNDDSVRPLRAYSVGSRSDTSAINKLRLGKNRLEAVQENFRTRAMSVGSKNPRRPGMNMAAPSMPISNGSRTMTPLSNSWSGSTGRWLPKFASSSSTHNHQNPSPAGYTYNHSHTNSESADSDLMELDFSKNKTRNRKRSLTNQVNNFITPPTPPNGCIAQTNKLSPVPIGTSVNEISPGSDASDSGKIAASSPVVDGPPSRNYASSAPISIQRNNSSVNEGFIYTDTNSSQTLSTMLKSNNDLKQLNETEDDSAYLPMDFTPSQKPKSEQVNSSASGAVKFLPGLSNFKPETPTTKSPIVVTPKLAPYPGTKFSLFTPASSTSLSSLTSPIKTAFSLTHEPPSQLTRSLSSSSNISTTSNNSNSSSASCVSVKSQSHPTDVNSSKFLGSETNATSLTVLPGLCRIEESPEKQHDSSKASSSGSVTPQSPNRHTPVGVVGSAIGRISDSDDQQVTYAAIEHVPTACRSPYPATGSSTSCGSTSNASNKMEAVTYAQIDFIKTSEAVKPKN